MVARDDKHALPRGGLPKAPTLMDCFLEALAKRGPRDRHLWVSISPSADPGPIDRNLADPNLADPSPALPKPSPAVGTQPDLFST